jgi:hypothetical protein
MAARPAHSGAAQVKTDGLKTPSLSRHPQSPVAPRKLMEHMMHMMQTLMVHMMQTLVVHMARFIQHMQCRDRLTRDSTLVELGEGACGAIEHQLDLAVGAYDGYVGPGAAEGVLHELLDGIPRRVRDDVGVHGNLERRDYRNVPAQPLPHASAHAHHAHGCPSHTPHPHTRISDGTEALGGVCKQYASDVFF